MSTLFVVRHGQASFFGDHYDELSDTGREQARRLGRHWVRLGLRAGRVFSGPRKRQIDTAAVVGEEFQSAGLDWPQTEVLDELDEYQAEEVLERALPELLERDERVRRLHAAVEASTEPEDQKRNFQRMYEVVIGAWADGGLPVDGVESWADFCEKVHRGFEQIIASADRGETVLAFTSGGPVGIAVEKALCMPREVTMRLAWMVKNGSFTEFLFSRDRFSLSSFNSLGHLQDDPKLVTYR